MMKLTVPRNELIQGLARAQSVADRKSSMPVLANVLLESEGTAGLRLSATDLHLGTTGVVPARIEEPGATTAHARTLFDIVRNLPDGDVLLTVDENLWLHVRSGRVHYRIAGIPAEDFPALPAAEEVEFVCFDASLLGRMIEQSYFAVSPDESRPHLNGALFEGHERMLRMVGTDGHRLSLSEREVETPIFDFNLLVPLRAIQELRRLLDEGGGDVEFGAGGPFAFFRRHLAGATEEGGETEVTMSVKLVDGRFPPYDKVIPAHTDRRVLVDRLCLLEALRRATLIGREKTLSVQLCFTDGRLTVRSDNPDVGEASEELDVQYEGGELVLGFNGRYVMDALQALDGDAVELSLNGPSDACVIRGVDEPGFLSVVMPMRI
jgi:DNA polymerase-3 subunit beta